MSQIGTNRFDQEALKKTIDNGLTQRFPRRNTKEGLKGPSSSINRTRNFVFRKSRSSIQRIRGKTNPHRRTSKVKTKLVILRRCWKKDRHVLRTQITKLLPRRRRDLNTVN